ncbi:hypothetical protein BU23DRAFT_417054, partial [Bimuria novae-zelandiae CBS 107.79]
VPTFESRLRDTQAADALIMPTKGSKATIVAIVEDNNVVEEGFNALFKDNFKGINFLRLPKYIKPLA